MNKRIEAGVEYGVQLSNMDLIAFGGKKVIDFYPEVSHLHCVDSDGNVCHFTVVTREELPEWNKNVVVCEDSLLSKLAEDFDSVTFDMQHD